MIKIKKMNNKGRLALAQITLLIFGIIAFGWILGSEVRVVSASTHKVTFHDGTTGIYETTDGGIYTYSSGEATVRTFVMDEGKMYIPSGDGESSSMITSGFTLGESIDTETPASLLDYTDAEIAENLANQAAAKVAQDKTSALPVPSDGTNDAFAQGSQEKQDTSGIGLTGSGNNVPDPPLTTSTIWKDMGSELWEGLQWAAIAATLIQLVGNLAGWDSDKTNAATLSAVGGLIAGKLVYGALKGGVWGGKTSWLGYSNSAWTGVGVGVVVAAIIFISMYKSEDTETIIYTCEQWQAPTGGNDCEECNKQGILPCSEYQCRSLGQSCQLINKGTDEEKCAWVNRKDVTPPVISLWKDALSKNFSYLDDKAVSPPDTGTKIIYKQSDDGCMPAFTPLEFGILTDEPAQCKLDYQRGTSISNMSYYFGGTSSFLYNHSQVMSLPGSDNLAEENITLKNGGEYSLFIRCIDSNGNANVATFAFRFCVDDGPDTTPPVIVGTNVLSDMPVAYNQSTLDLEVYTNEPATCRWSHENDNDYEDMDNNMTCSSSVLEMNAQMVYECDTQLTGIENEQENNYFIRCEDQPLAEESDRNRNSESYEFNVIGTKQLAIDYVKPNGTTIKDSTESVNVTLEAKTLGGYKEGNSTCYYNSTGDKEGIMFYNTNSYLHSQVLWLPEGEYVYTIKCVDLGGNADRADASFSVETDTEAPIVVRAYNEESNLKIITDEPAECVYGTDDCKYSLEDGTKMNSINKNDTQHYVKWDTDKTFYIKCEDKYGTEPSPDECSIILKPSEQMIVQN
jgi:hypothetical protein